MVTNSATFGRSGVHDFILIRASAVILALYCVYILSFIAFNDINFLSWTNFFSCIPTKVFTFCALLAMVVHAWIGTWQVLSDYVKPVAIRLVSQFILIIIALAYFGAGISIIWG